MIKHVEVLEKLLYHLDCTFVHIVLLAPGTGKVSGVLLYK